MPALGGRRRPTSCSARSGGPGGDCREIMFTLADIANGPAILTIGLFGGGVLFLAVVLIETVALRLLKWSTFWRSLRDSLVANAASALVGLLIGCVALSDASFRNLALLALIGACML